MTSISNNDMKALSLLYDRFSEKVYNTALSYTKNIEDAEEITQDVFVKIYNSASGFKANATLSTWIYRITINTSINYVKKNKRMLQLKNTMEGSRSVDFQHPGVILEHKENINTIYKAMDCLPDSQKTVFILSYIEDLPRKKIAEIMETSLKAVESLLQRAKKKMQSELEYLYPDRRKSIN